MSSKKGVSLIELVIVVITLIIIASFTVFSGKDSIEKAEAAEIFSEITNVKKAVNGVIVQMDLEDKYNDEEWLSKFYNIKDSDWYEIYGMDMEDEYHTPKSNDVRKNLDLDSLKRSYKVNFTTGDVKLSKPINILGEVIESYDEIRTLVESNKI